MLIIIAIALAIISQSQLTTTLGDVTFSFFPISSLQMYSDSSSPNYPNDYFITTATSVDHIYTLGSNNIVQVYGKSNPSKVLQIFASYSYSEHLPFTFIYLSIDQFQKIMVLTSYYGGVLQHLVFELNTTGIVKFCNLTGDHQFLESPSKSFIKENRVYSYFRHASSNDYIYVVSIQDNSSYIVQLASSNCSLSVSPDRQKVLVWDSRSRLYIYSVIDNFSLRYIFNESLNSPAGRTNSISFSSDSKLAILQTDNLNPIKVINLTDFSTIANITVHGRIQSAIFIDPDNRFLLIKASTGDLIYDLKTSAESLLNDTLPFSSLATASDVGELFNIGTNTIECFGMNVMEGNVTLMNYQIIEVNNINSLKNQQNQMDESEFYLILDCSEVQNRTLSLVGDQLAVVNVVIEKSFSVIFSTPLAIYFFSVFNYFTLSSLYVLLNIRIPEAVFSYLSLLEKACQSDILSQFDFFPNVEKLSSQRVTNKRALYFEVSSDLFFTSGVNLMIVGVNILIYELIVILVGTKALYFKSVHKILLKERMSIYWGLIVSNMIFLVLPWRYSLLGGASNAPSKINMGIQYLLLLVLPLLLVFSFLSELCAAKRLRQINPYWIRAAFRQWWISYQNFVYPLLLLIDPRWFMTIIGLSNVLALYNSFYVRKWMFLCVLKGIYPVIFHSCFAIFMTASGSSILVIASIVCLTVFLIGSIHHLLETIVVVIRFFFRVIRKRCRTSKIKPVSSSKLKIKNRKQQRSSVEGSPSSLQNKECKTQKTVTFVSRSGIESRVKEKKINRSDLIIKTHLNLPGKQRSCRKRVKMVKQPQKASDLLFIWKDEIKNMTVQS